MPLLLFAAQVVATMTDPINIAGPILAGIFIRRFGWLALACVVWAILVQLLVAYLAARQQLVVNHGAIFVARFLGCLIAASTVWGIVQAIRRRNSA